MNVRHELGQLSWALKEHRSRSSLAKRARAGRGLTLPKLPLRRRKVGEVWAVTMVRDEADVIGHTVRHLLAQGVDGVIVADNMSRDATPDILADLARTDGRVHLARDDEPSYLQAEKMTWLAQAAWRTGADWVVPFDADEFWFAPDRSVAEYLRQERASTVHAGFHHMVPTTADPADLLSAEFVMSARSASPDKVAVRSHPFLVLGPGNHYAARVGGTSSGLHIAHALYRGPSQVARKVRQGMAAVRLAGEALVNLTPSWDKGSRLADEDIYEVWLRVSAGLADDRLEYHPPGPMVRCRPLLWQTWDPIGLLAPPYSI